MNSERKEKLALFLNERLPECKTDWEDFGLFVQEAAITHLEGKKWFQMTGLTIRTMKYKVAQRQEAKQERA